MKSNMEIVQDAYGKFATADIAGLLDLLSEDVHWQTPEIENATFGGKRRGQEEVAKFFAALDAEEDMTIFEPLDFVDKDDKVIVLGRSAATVRATGQHYETEWVQIFTVKEEKIVSFVEFFDNAAATRAFQKVTNA